LVIGGTGFISTYAVESLLDAGYKVTILTRGETADIFGQSVQRYIVDCEKQRKKFIRFLQRAIPGAPDFKAVESNSDIESNSAQEHLWDLVIDFICFEPPHAEAVVEGLSGRAKLFVFISTDSVYEVTND
jgi:nucleoside-diphosphate-sugar epimerase